MSPQVCWNPVCGRTRPGTPASCSFCCQAFGTVVSNGVVFSVQSKSPLKFPASNKLKIGDICSCGSHTVKSPNVFFFFLLLWGSGSEWLRPSCGGSNSASQLDLGLNPNSCYLLAEFAIQSLSLCILERWTLQCVSSACSSFQGPAGAGLTLGSISSGRHPG